MKMKSIVVSVLVLMAIVVDGSVVIGACAASTRQDTIRAALVTTDASRDAFLAYDAAHQLDIVAHSTSHDDDLARLGAYRAKRARFETALIVAYRTIAAAATINDQPSLDGVKLAMAQLVLAFNELRGVPSQPAETSGGAK